jgi:Dolichyl-phosphate-mannose-protein mannosyltransferase
MAERAGRTELAPSCGWKKDAVALGLLVLLVLPLRLWLLVHTEVAARDSIGYIRYALEFETGDWKKITKVHDQHPGYALTVLAVSQPLRSASGQTDAATMQLAAQLTTVMAAMLLLYPMYHVGRLLFNRPTGFGAALLYQVLPINAQHLSDGISEGLFLFLVASALLHGVRALQGQSPFRFALCGLISGLAYLTRLEGAMVAMAAGGVLVGMQCIPSRRMPWPRFLACGLALLLALTAAGSIYVYATDELSRKDVFRQVISLLCQWLGIRDVTVQTGTLGGPLFAIYFQPSVQPSVRLGRCVGALAFEVANGFHYAGVTPLLLGAALTLGRLRRLPGFWLLALYCSIHATAVLALALKASYVSDRHVMVLVMCGSYLAVAGLIELPRRVMAYLPGNGEAAARSVLLSPTLWSAVLFGAMIGICLPKALQPLHANRAGNRAAGEWLATQLRPGDIVDDDHCWSHFYAGQVFLEGKVIALPAESRPISYVVRTRSRDPEIDESRRQDEGKLREARKIVYWWPENADVEKARVVIYAGPRDPVTHPWPIIAE